MFSQNTNDTKTEFQIKYLRGEAQIKKDIEEARKLESYLGIGGTPPYGEHNKDWWNDENQVNNYLSVLREKAANKKIEIEETLYIEDTVHELRDKENSESEEEKGKSVDLEHQHTFDDIENLTNKRMKTNNHNQENTLKLPEPDHNQNKNMNKNKSELSNAVDGLRFYTEGVSYYTRKIEALTHANTNETVSSSPVKPIQEFLTIQFNNITYNNNSYNIGKGQSSSLINLERVTSEEKIMVEPTQKQEYKVSLVLQKELGKKPLLSSNKDENVREDMEDRRCFRCNII